MPIVGFAADPAAVAPPDHPSGEFAIYFGPASHQTLLAAPLSCIDYRCIDAASDAKHVRRLVK